MSGANLISKIMIAHSIRRVVQQLKSRKTDWEQEHDKDKECPRPTFIPADVSGSGIIGDLIISRIPGAVSAGEKLVIVIIPLVPGAVSCARVTVGEILAHSIMRRTKLCGNPARCVLLVLSLTRCIHVYMSGPLSNSLEIQHATRRTHLPSTRYAPPRNSLSVATISFETRCTLL